jgi:hypothetical protein
MEKPEKELSNDEVLAREDPRPARTYGPTRLFGGISPAEAEIELHRLTLCKLYENCLTTVCRTNWSSFTCIPCEIYKLAKKGVRGLCYPKETVSTNSNSSYDPTEFADPNLF